MNRWGQTRVVRYSQTGGVRPAMETRVGLQH